MKKMIKKLTTWLLVFGMTFTPAFTSINLVAVNAEDADGETVINVQTVKQVEDEQKTANTPTPENQEPSAENTGAQQLIENAQTNLNQELTNESKQDLLDTSALGSDLQQAADKIGVGGEEPTGAQKNLADAKTALEAAGNADSAVTTLLAGSEGLNAIVSYVQETDPEGNLLFNEDGTPVWKVAVDEQGNMITDEDGNPVYVTVVVPIPVMPETFKGTGDQTESSANTAINRARTATTEADANAAKAALGNAETGLAQAEADVTEAEQKVDAAKAVAQDALAKKLEAEAEVVKAQEALDKALVQVGTDEKGNPIYAGNVEEAEAALEKAVEDATELAGKAADAVNAAKDANLDLIKEKLDKLYEYKANHPEWTKDSYPEEYKKLARDLCKAVLMNKFYQRGIQNAEFGVVLESIEFVTDFTLLNEIGEDGQPIGTPAYDENGNIVKDTDGNILYYLEYEPVITTETTKTGAIGTDKTAKWIISTRDNAENGETNNRIAIRYFVDGKPVYEYYNYKANDDGSIYIFERQYSIVDGETFLDEKEATAKKVVTQEHQDATPWKTADGKEFVETETTHTVPVKDAENGEFYAIDTETSTRLESIPGLDVDNAPAGTTYTAQGEPTAEYEYGTKTVETGEFNKKTVTTTERISTWSEDSIETQYAAYKEEHPDAKLYYHHTGVYIPFLGVVGDYDEEIKTDKPGWWKELKASVKDFLGLKAFFVQSSEEVDDPDSPKTKEVEGIWETITQTYEKVTQTLGKEEEKTASKNHTHKQNAEADVQGLVDKWAGKGYTILESGVKDNGKSGDKKKYYAFVKIAKITNKTETVTSVTKTLYAADVFVTPAQDEVAEESHMEYTYGNKELVKQQLEWTADNDQAFEGQKVISTEEILKQWQQYKELDEQQKKLDQAVLDANEALLRVKKLKNQLKDRQQMSLQSAVAYAGFMEKLSAAEAELEAAQDRVVELEELVARARAAVRAINLPGDDDETSGTPSTTPDVVATITGTPVLPVLPTAGAASAVAGVRVAAGDAADEGVAAPAAAVEAPKAVEAPVTLEDETLPAAAEATTLEDEDLAGAQGVEEGAMMWWIWLLIVLAAAAGFGVYKYVDNKKKNANTVNK